MATKRSSSGRRYGQAASKSVESAMHREKRGTLRRGRGGRGGRVTDPKQAIAIGLSEAREKGAKVPPRTSAAKKSGAKRSTTKRSTTKRSTAKKSTAKRSGARKAGAKRTTAKRSAARKSAARR